MEQEITNQHLVARPGHVNVQSAGSQCELGPTHRGRPIAILQSVTTPWQGLATWRPGLQIRPQSHPRQKDTLDPERPEDCEECVPFDAPAYCHWGGFPQNPEPANQVSPVSGASHGQNVWYPESFSRLHMGHALSPKRLCSRCDNITGSVCQLHL